MGCHHKSKAVIPILMSTQDTIRVNLRARREKWLLELPNVDPAATAETFTATPTSASLIGFGQATEISICCCTLDAGVVVDPFGADVSFSFVPVTMVLMSPTQRVPHRALSMLATAYMVSMGLMASAGRVERRASDDEQGVL